MWIGLCDDDQTPIHPSVIGWADLDLIPWRLLIVDVNQLIVSNREAICFPVHELSRASSPPKYFALFKELDDPTFYSRIAPLVASVYDGNIIAPRGALYI